MPSISAATLSWVALRPNPKSVEVPGCLVAAYSFLNLSSKAHIAKGPGHRAAGRFYRHARQGLRNMRPMSAPQKPPETAPAPC